MRDRHPCGTRQSVAVQLQLTPSPPDLSPTAAAAAEDCVSIRQVRLKLADLVDRSQLAPARLADWRARFLAAEPFPHLVIDGLFDAGLLELVKGEFDALGEAKWRNSRVDELEHTFRSLPGQSLGAASDLYFSLINSGWFLDVLTTITGVDDLIADTKLQDGGFHESRTGGVFAIHTDFEKHTYTRLDNELVLITYLNKDWDPAYGGALELWSAATQRSVREVQPVFGRTLLMRHGPTSLHGHPSPMRLPAGVTRRSVAAYYYTNRHPNTAFDSGRGSTFLYPGWGRTLKNGARELTPPILWRGIKRLVER
jgi:hypothetical protein